MVIKTKNTHTQNETIIFNISKPKKMMNSQVAKKRIIKKGWLKKQGGLVKTWHWRWFILNGDCLFYFAKEDDIKILGNIYLPGNRIIEHPFRPDEADKFLFEILPGKGQTKMSANHESFLLCAGSNVERQEWISVVRRVMYSSLGGAIFGQSLAETMAFEHKLGRAIPHLVEQSVEFIQEYGVETEGILRLAGRTALLRELKESFDMGTRIIFDISLHDVHTVASLLKMYFRELPESTIPCDCYQKFMNHALRYQDNKLFDEIENLKVSLEILPDDNYKILAYICQFLNKIGKNCENNKMTEWNLATVFGPNIIRHIDDSPALFMATADLTQELTYMLIHHCEYLFPVEQDVILRTREMVVPVDDLLRMSRTSNAANRKVLTPEPTGPANRFDGVFRDGLKAKAVTLPRQESCPTWSNSKRHGKLNMDLVKCATEPSSAPASSLPDGTLGNHSPVPATRRSKPKNIRRHPALDVAAAGDQPDEKSDNVFVNSNSQSELALRKKLGRTISEPITTTHDDEGGDSSNNSSQPQLDELKLDLVQTKMEYCEQVESLKTELVEQKRRYEERIKFLESSCAAQIKDSMQKLEREKVTTAEAIEKIMELQSSLTQYQMKFGELP